jgi:hypothetical protein
MSETPVSLRWPKGPFPEKYNFDRVTARVDGAWLKPECADYLARCTRIWSELDPNHDPWLHLFRITLDEAAFDAEYALAQEAGVTLFRWCAPGKVRRAAMQEERTLPDVIGIVPTRDVVDALSIVGASGPHYGIGMAAIVRFLVALRSFVAPRILELGEDRLALGVPGLDDNHALRVAYRVFDLCLPLREQHTDARSLADALLKTSVLALDWPPR